MVARRKKKIPKPTISKEERERRRQQRKAALLAAYRPLLYDRELTAHLLSCSIAKVQRLEKAGLLTPAPKQSPGAKTLYPAAQVHALAGDEAAAS